MADQPKSDDIALAQTQHPAQTPGPEPGTAELQPGMVLSGTYKLVHMLGRGGMGEVWKAEHLRLPKPVAIKVLLKAMSDQGELVKRFMREAEIGSKLAHPHIVHVFDFNELEDGRKYIAMDYLDGQPLQSRLEQGRSRKRKSSPSSSRPGWVCGSRTMLASCIAT